MHSFITFSFKMRRACLSFGRKASSWAIGSFPGSLAPRFRLERLNRFNQGASKPPVIANNNAGPLAEQSTLQLIRREFMMKRIALIKVPFRLGTIEFPYSLSNIAGHGSFLCLAFSYLESDVMNLRVYAFTGISLSILFQYCREIPLWIPIRWNGLFLMINALMIALLVKEANDASNIPEEQEQLFMTVFSKHSMKPVDFLRLMSIAERHAVAKGDKIVEQGRKHQHLHLIQSGKLTVRRDNNQVGVILAYQFAGAMSFLTWEGNYEIKRKARKEQEGEFLLWEEFSDGGWGGLKLNFPAAGLDSQDSTSEKQHHDEHKGREEIDWELGYADVTCEEDCVVYSWGFKELHELLASHPRIGLVVEGCISKDLNKKMTATWLTNPQQQYKHILAAALTDGEVTEKERRGFKKFCQENGINNERHVQLLKDCGWSEEEYLAGYKRGTRPVSVPRLADHRPPSNDRRGNSTSSISSSSNSRDYTGVSSVIPRNVLLGDGQSLSHSSHISLSSSSSDSSTSGNSMVSGVASTAVAPAAGSSVGWLVSGAWSAVASLLPIWYFTQQVAAKNSDHNNGTAAGGDDDFGSASMPAEAGVMATASTSTTTTLLSTSAAAVSTTAQQQQQQQQQHEHFYRVGANGKLMKMSRAEVEKLRIEEERERSHMQEQYHAG